MRLAAIFLLLASPALAEVPRVVTDFGPIQSLVSDVMGDLGSPVALLPSGGDPHDFQLRPSQAKVLSQADLIFWNGPDLIPALADAMTALAPQAQSVALLQGGGGKTRRYDDGGIDPHGWLDPQNGMAWASTIAKALAARDPANAATYLANAARTAADLQALDAELTTLLTPVKDRPFVTYHDALGYFTDHYGLALAGAVQLGDATSPSAAQLAHIRDILASSQAICVFPEAGRDPKFITSLTEMNLAGLQVHVGPPQDFEFVEMPAGRGQYAVMLRAIAQGLTDCLAAK